MRSIALPAVVCGALALGACSDPESERIKDTTKPTYDKSSGKLIELTYDANKNGKVDTWTDMDGAKPLRARIDSDEDGTIDRWEYYDQNGALLKVGYSRKRNGKPDAWAFAGPDGEVFRVETEDDTNDDGRPDKWEVSENGALKTAAMDDDGDGVADRRLTYDGGILVLIESEPDTTGTYRKRVVVR